MRKTYKYRLYPTRKQVPALEGQLTEACRLYNAALKERRDALDTHDPRCVSSSARIFTLYQKKNQQKKLVVAKE